MRRSYAVLAVATIPLVAGCAGPEAMLDAQGPAAGTTATMWWVMFWMGTAIYVVVMALVGVAFVRARRSKRGRPDHADHAGHDIPAEDDTPVPRRLVLYGGILGPLLVLLVLNLVMAPMGASVNDRGASADGVDNPTEDVVIEVVAEKFWWRVTYPELGVTTANEIHLPAQERVRLRITSADVIHSFWVPQLAGKIDATPGHTTELVLEADEPGRYRGRCTEFCGLAHAQMVVWAVAQEREEFDDWVQTQTQPQPEDISEELERGREVFFGSSCVYCHAIEGHGPPNTIGPDLTHLASRETIAGGILDNTRGNLGGWIVDPQSLKPGNLMPGTQIAGAELDALLDYLESLQ